MHPYIAAALVDERLADLRRSRRTSGPYRRAPRPDVRDRIGWFLVELGLRLATPRPTAG